MKLLKHISYGIAVCTLCLSLFQCAGAKQTNSEKSLDVEEVYYKALDSINRELYIVVKPNSQPLDHVYFQGRKISLAQDNSMLYIGHYQKLPLAKQDVIMSDKPFAEYGNKLPVLPEKIPFNFKENECMIGYKLNDEYQYFKYSKVIRK